ncbi:Uu.00g086510.m01.CDS01 [Anthostomella pinea]|uniref:Protein farnesyltransferase/geranylgeranyltransferase type-1 subunit alpha n=1 Tax=Anthostomella pinea TaxID=933095 RepID=A0AAI8VNB4_9PEZI|nr:Uu.00g086510.m01.CDS01 [Anthostomella pinea]
MATLLHESNTYSANPQWDDVTPIPQVEPEGALAAIAYPEDYAEGSFTLVLLADLNVHPVSAVEEEVVASMSYLRAVMAAKELSRRCLGLTEHIISMNPAHYTVWLYRFENVEALGILIPDELAWLNEVSLMHLKNYQIWHHRQQLIDHYYPTLIDNDEGKEGNKDTPSSSSSPTRQQYPNEKVAALAASERAFLTQMLEQDTKNYHVWSYRQYLVRKLGAFGDPAELRSIEALVDEDVRNNSAWSHRFFLAFSDPVHTTPGSHATEHDPAVPAAIVDREVAYAQAKIGLAPQNQSPWNYLRGALVKGGRALGSVRAFAEGFVEGLGEGDEKERVRSSHALDLLAVIYKEAGERERADLCLRRLGDKWDRIRKGYWEYRRRLLDS